MSVNVPLEALPQAIERFGRDALIVDGRAAVYDSPDTSEVVFVQPGEAVLHISKS